MESPSEWITTNAAADGLRDLHSRFLLERGEAIPYTGVEPTRAHDSDAGYDLWSLDPVTLGPGLTRVRTGTHVGIPAGHVGIVKDRSSMAAKDIHVFGGVIDSGYTGEIEVMLYNFGPLAVVERGQRIAQLIITPCVTAPMVRVDTLEPTARGAGGFGSTGA